MRIFFMNNTGGGFGDFIDVPDGTAVAQLFASKFPGKQACDFIIKVNRERVAAEEQLRSGDRVVITPNQPTMATVLQEGDRISATPLTVKGAQTFR